MVMHIHQMTYTATPLHKNPIHRGHEVYKLEDPSFIIITILHVYILYSSEACSTVHKEIKKGSWDIEIYMFVRPFHGHHYNVLDLS